MKFTAVIALRLLGSLGNTECCESKLLEVVQDTLCLTTLPENQEQNIIVQVIDPVTVDIEMDPGTRDPECVKDILHEALINFFDPDYCSDVEVEINNEM
jgi:hypothetical protein